MGKLRATALFILLGTQLWGAEARWIRMPSADFEIFSSAGEGDTRRALQHFERVRNFFDQALGGKQAKPDPVRIIIFGSKKDYQPYKPNQVAAAFYTQIAGRDYIVMGEVGDEVFPVAVHEYVHLVAQHAGLDLPPWFNEGLAELYSTMKPSGNEIILGTPILGRVQELMRQKWVPLETIVSADHNSPYYNEKNKAGSLYDEGWLLVHMMMLNDAYRPQLAQALTLIEKGTPSKDALEKAYGKPISQIDRDLQNYLRGGTYHGAAFPLKFQGGEKAAAEPANPFDVKMALLDLSNRPGKEEESRRQLEALAADDPKRPEPQVGLGYLAWRQGHNDEARASFEKAVELGSQNPRMLWDYGRMAMQANPPGAIHALEMLLAAQPDRFEVRLALAEAQTNAKRSKDVLLTLLPVKTVTAKDAPTFFHLLAFASLNDGNPSASHAQAQRWLDSSKEEKDRDEATRFLRYLDGREQSKQAALEPPPPLVNRTAAPESPTGPSEDPPHLRRQQDPLAAGLNTRKRPYVVGTMAELDCKEEHPKLVLRSGTERVILLMDQPRIVMLSGLDNAVIDMNCGPQQAREVWVEYDAPDASQKGITGLLRAIHFEPIGAPGAAGPGTAETH